MVSCGWLLRIQEFVYWYLSGIPRKNSLAVILSVSDSIYSSRQCCSRRYQPAFSAIILCIVRARFENLKTKGNRHQITCMLTKTTVIAWLRNRVSSISLIPQQCMWYLQQHTDDACSSWVGQVVKKRTTTENKQYNIFLELSRFAWNCNNKICNNKYTYIYIPY